MKSSPAKLLFSRATTIIINATIRNRHATRFDDNLNNVLALHRKMIGLWEHAGIVDDFVRNILQLSMKILYANHGQVIIDTNINLSTLSISEAGYPFQVFVFPYALMFNVLILLIHSAKLAKNHEIDNDRIHIPKVMSLYFMIFVRLACKCQPSYYYKADAFLHQPICPHNFIF